MQHFKLNNKIMETKSQLTKREEFQASLRRIQTQKFDSSSTITLEKSGTDKPNKLMASLFGHVKKEGESLSKKEMSPKTKFLRGILKKHGDDLT
jgi:hypothetical protein